MIAEPDVLISRVPDQLSVELDGEIAILNLKSKLYFGLTDVGAFIWNLLETPISLAALGKRVSEHFEVGIVQAKFDAQLFLTELDGAGLLQMVRQGEAAD